MSTYAHARTASGRYLGSLMCSDEHTDGEQRASVPVVLDDSNGVYANNIIDDVQSRPHTAESAPGISSKPPQAMSNISSVNPAQNIHRGDISPAQSQPVSSYDDPAASRQGQGGPPTAKTPLRDTQSPLATSHTAGHTQETTTTTDIPSLTVVGSSPVAPNPPDYFPRPLPQDDRLMLTGRSSPVNDRDRRQSRRRSVMDVSLPTVISVEMGSPLLTLTPLLKRLTANAVAQCNYTLPHMICAAARYSLYLSWLSSPLLLSFGE